MHNSTRWSILADYAWKACGTDQVTMNGAKLYSALSYIWEQSKDSLVLCRIACEMCSLNVQSDIFSAQKAA